MVGRIRDFRRRLERKTADRVVRTRTGRAILADSIPDVYDCNYLSVTAPAVGADELAADADAALEGRHHRRVIVEDGVPGLAPEFQTLGYDLSTHLVLVHTREADRLVDTSAVREVHLEDLVPARTAATLGEPWGDPGIAAQLNDAKRLVAHAVPTRFFAAITRDEIAGWCELRTRDGVSQIEDVEVLPEHRGRGLGRALVQHALLEARRSSHVVFLEALADDWPRQLYAKLGFTLVDRRDFYTRLPQAVTRLRVRTPRLELRYPTVAELRALYRIAEAGPDEESFVAAQRAKEIVRPEQWELRLAVFHDGAPIGTQTLGADRFAHTRTVDTDSRLDRVWQGGGLEAEAHAAALALAFERLGAQTARTADGATVDRGEPRDVPVEIAGIEQLLPLLGAVPMDAAGPAA